MAAFKALLAALFAALTIDPAKFLMPFAIPFTIFLPIELQSILNGFLILVIKLFIIDPILPNKLFIPLPRPLIILAPVLNRFKCVITFRIAFTISPAFAMIVGMD